MTLNVNVIIDGVTKDQNLSKGQKVKLEKAFTEIFEKGALPKDALGLSNETMEAMYAHGYRLYQSAKYKDAGYIFHLLQTLNPADPRNYLGMGACLHRLGKYETAVFMYQVAADLEKENPMPFYYYSDCAIKMGHLNKAIFLLKEVVKRAGSKTEYEAIKDRAQMTIRSLEEEVKTKPAPQPPHAGFGKLFKVPPERKWEQEEQAAQEEMKAPGEVKK